MMRRSRAGMGSMVTVLPVFTARSAMRLASARSTSSLRSRYPSTSTRTLTRSPAFRLSTKFRRYWIAASVSPLRPMRRPASSPSISKASGAGSAFAPFWLGPPVDLWGSPTEAATPMVRSSPSMVSFARSTTSARSAASARSTPSGPRGRTRTRASSEPRPGMPPRPLSTTTTSTSSRSTPSSLSALSIASSTVLPVISSCSMGLPLSGASLSRRRLSIRCRLGQLSLP